MSPNNNQHKQSEHSPWTEAFQENPLHREGSYERDYPQADEAQLPTQTALSSMYDHTDRY